MDFADQHVVVTGGTGALGTAVVAALAERGAWCHIPYVTEAKAERFPFRDHPKVRMIGDSDLTDEGAVRRLFDRTPDLWASIHLAGGFSAQPIGDLRKADLTQQIEMNLMTAFLCSQAAIATMRGAGAGGRIVNVAARPSLEWRTGSGMVAYTASKAAVAAMTVALAEEVAKDNILVNAVAPSILDTAANRAAMPKAKHELWPKVEEVAQTILFLASPDNRVTRGAVVEVYGKS